MSAARQNMKKWNEMIYKDYLNAARKHKITCEVIADKLNEEKTQNLYGGNTSPPGSDKDRFREGSEVRGQGFYEQTELFLRDRPTEDIRGARKADDGERCHYREWHSLRRQIPVARAPADNITAAISYREHQQV